MSKVKVKVEIDEISAKFIVTAILFQKEGGVIFEDDSSDDDFKQNYGFSRKQLTASLNELRKQIPLSKSIRERMFDGEFNEPVEKKSAFQLKPINNKK